MAIGFENPTTCLFRTTHLLILENCPLNMLIQDLTVIRATRVNNVLSDAGTVDTGHFFHLSLPKGLLF